MSAQDLFFDYLLRHDASHDEGFEELCRQNPSAVAELEVLREDLLRAERFLELLERARDVPGGRQSGEVDEVPPRQLLSTREALDSLSARSSSHHRFRPLQADTSRMTYWDPRLERAVELTAVAGSERGSSERLFEHARKLARLRHAAFLPLHEAGCDPERGVYFTTRRAEGVTLDQLLAKSLREGGASDTAKVIDALAHAAEALGEAHSIGLVHGRLTPKSILVGDHGNVQVVDVTDPHEVSPPVETDIFGLGRMLGDLVARGGPKELEAIRQKALTPVSSGGYPSATLLADDLRAFLDGRVVRAYRTDAVAEFTKWAGRHRLAAATAAVSLIVLVVSLALYGNSMTTDRLRAELARMQSTRERNSARHSLSLATARQQEIEHSGAALTAQALTAEAATLWPASPSSIPRIRAWLADARPLLEVRMRVKERLVALREHATPLTEAERRNDLLAHPLQPLLAEELARHDRQLANIDRLMGRGQPHLVEIARVREGWTRSLIAALRPRVEERLTFSFGDDRARAREERSLGKAAGDLELFLDGSVPMPGRDGMYCDTLTGVEQRLECALEMQRLESEPATEDLWKEVARYASRASGPYSGLRVVPQEGLIPLRIDPASGLWEFWHVQSGERPRLGEGHSSELTRRSGIILVLIPGGQVEVGELLRESAPGDPGLSRAQEEALSTTVPIRPFFMSKYELTQSQWRRIWGENPSQYTAGVLEADWTSPVERVSHRACVRTLEKLGLALPTEAQWVLAARGGLQEWDEGADWGERLREQENIADLAFSEATGVAQPAEPWNDGFPVHAAAGSFAPGPFGLHDMLGNVREWCLDNYADDTTPPRPVDGLRRGDSELFIVRGGSFLDPLEEALPWAWRWTRETQSQYYIGCRPARPLRP